MLHWNCYFFLNKKKHDPFSEEEEIINFFPLIEKSDNLSNMIPFAKNLLNKEIANLPRDIAHRAMAKIRQPWRNKEETTRHGNNHFFAFIECIQSAAFQKIRASF